MAEGSLGFVFGLLLGAIIMGVAWTADVSREDPGTLEYTTVQASEMTCFVLTYDGEPVGFDGLNWCEKEGR